MFSLISTEEFPQRQMTGRLFRHECGLEVLSLECVDQENLFSICFKTIPTDNTGVAHILEHSVLEGSRNYPVKDPFVCMLKSSVAAFINAMTYPDRTIYPCTSCCRKDYFNLFDVYWDAVFHPRLTRDTFMQEGWHYELSGAGKQRKLKVNGIVFNEMSGAYSGPERLLGRTMETELFGDTPLKYESGGEPESIPRLSYNAFCRFHREHYSPRVARIVLYGDIPTEEKLSYIEAQLRQTLPAFGDETADARASFAAGAIEHPRPIAAPRHVVRRHIPEPSASLDESIVALAWDVSTVPRNPELDLGLQLLEAVLFGSAGAPLSRALMESRIGTAPMASGYDNETLCCSFSVAMRGVKKGNCRKFENLVIERLRDIVRDGLEPVYVQTAVSAYQMENQSIDNNYVIDLLEDVVASWNYSDDPYIFLRQSEQLTKIKELLSHRPRYFEELIQSCLLDNPRRVCIQLRPDASLKKKNAARRSEKLSRILKKWTDRRIRKTLSDAARLQKNALTPDTPEALATLPTLTRSDLPETLPLLPYEDGLFSSGVPVRRGRVNHNGVAQMELLADVSQAPMEIVSALPLFCHFFKTLGNAQADYASTSAEMARLGVAFELKLAPESAIDSPAVYRILTISCNGLEKNFPAALQLLRRQLDSIVFTERRRMVEVLRSIAAQWRANLTKRLNIRFCTSRALYGLMDIGGEQEQFFGVNGYFQSMAWSKLTEATLDEVIARMIQVAGYLRQMKFLSAGVVGNHATMTEVEKFCNAFGYADSLNPSIAFCQPRMVISPAKERHEFCGIQTDVATCVRILKAPHASSLLRAPVAVFARMMSAGYLWDEIRAKGGAYHAHAKYVPALQYLELASTEDPNPENTYRVFEGIPSAIASGELCSAAEVEKAVLACCGRYIAPVRPVGYASELAASVLEHTGNDTRQREYDALRRVTPKEIREACECIFDESMRRFNDCAIGPSGALNEFTQIDLQSPQSNQG